MNFSSLVARTLYVVDRSLRKEFPADYYKRCMYAAFGTQALLADAGTDAAIVGGEFLAFVVAASGERAGLQGFGYGEGESSHYWVQAEGTIVDLGPHYLPDDARYAAAPLPFVAWSPASALPKFLRYRAQIHYSSAVTLQSTPEIVARVDAFVRQCRARFAAQRGQPKLPGWVLADTRSLQAAARGGDFWAQNALRFEGGIEEADLPF